MGAAPKPLVSQLQAACGIPGTWTCCCRPDMDSIPNMITSDTNDLTVNFNTPIQGPIDGI